MASTHLSAAELLALEDRQIGFFLADVRPLDRHAADLYPVPQVLHTACIALAAQLPPTIDRILARVGGPEAFALRLRRVLSHATAQDVAGAALVATWGREMARLDEPDAPGGPSDAGCAAVLRFCYEVARHYRADGEPHPDDAAGLGSNYRILPATEAQALAQRCQALTPDQAGEILELTRAMRALSFLLEGQTREAVMMHGPYPTGARGVQLIVVECADLAECGSLAIAMLVRDCDIAADRFGTLHLQPWEAHNVACASLLTRGPAPLAEEELSEIPIARAAELRRRCEEQHALLSAQIAQWDRSRRLSAGIGLAHRLLCRLLTAAGYSRAELEQAQRDAQQASVPIVARHFDRNLRRADDELPFFAKVREAREGSGSRLFTPFCKRVNRP